MRIGVSRGDPVSKVQFGRILRWRASTALVHFVDGNAQGGVKMGRAPVIEVIAIGSQRHTDTNGECEKLKHGAARQGRRGNV